MCQNVEKIITETEYFRIIKILNNSISRKKRKLPKCSFPKLKKKKKRILKLPMFQNPENSKLANFQIGENNVMPNFHFSGIFCFGNYFFRSILTHSGF